MDLGRFVLTLAHYDDDPHGHVLQCEAVAECEGFRGQAPFWAPRAQMDDFAGQLDQLDARLAGEATLDCAFISEGAVQVRLAPWGHSGRLEVAVALTTDDGRYHVRLTFFVLPNALTTFRLELAALLDARDGVASLVGDLEAAG